MSIASVEPHQLIARLERKYERKKQAEESRRQVKTFRHNLSRIDGVKVGYLKQEINSLQYFDQGI